VLQLVQLFLRSSWSLLYCLLIFIFIT
jgi:hypothetical protein